jgi:hypothetical protein
MEWLKGLVTEFFVRPCWKLGNSGFLRLFDHMPTKTQDRLETFRSGRKCITHIPSSACGRNDIEFIVVRTKEASRGPRKRMHITMLAVETVEADSDKHASKKTYPRQ